MRPIDFDVTRYAVAAPERAKAALAHFRSLGATGLWPAAVLFADAHIELRREGSLLVLSEMWVSPSHRGTGAGSKHLDQLCRIADLWRVSVKIRVVPYGRGRRLGVAALANWYARRGFEHVQGAVMLRKPRRDPPPNEPLRREGLPTPGRGLHPMWESVRERRPRATSR